MQKAQETMSGVASEYDVPRLIVGTALALLVCGLNFFTMPKLRPVSFAGIYYALTIALYAILMFASSYVEEEHNFWYWATSGWFLVLLVDDIRKESPNRRVFHPAIMTLVLHRVIRRWNQTGQKYAGADDIVNSGIFTSSWIVLWPLIGATYLDVTLRLARHIARSIATFDAEQKKRGDVEIDSTGNNRMMGTVAVMPLAGTAFVFKLAFTAKDAPELTYGMTENLLESIDTLNLVGLAQMVFGGLALSAGWIIFAEWQRSKKRKRRGAEGNGGKWSDFWQRASH